MKSAISNHIVAAERMPQSRAIDAKPHPREGRMQSLLGLEERKPAAIKPSKRGPPLHRVLERRLPRSQKPLRPRRRPNNDTLTLLPHLDDERRRNRQNPI